MVQFKGELFWMKDDVKDMEMWKKRGKKNKKGEEVESEKIKSKQEIKKECGRIFT